MLELPAPDWLWALLVALQLEAAIGEPHRWHPLVGFGRLADSLERRLNCGPGGIWRGLLAWSLLLAGALAVFCALRLALGWLADALVLWFALGARSLQQHVAAIARPLAAGDLATARERLSRIVSRDCSGLDAGGVSRAAIESTLENGADAIFASLFWFAVGGGAAALAHRLANTLDAMWGYRTQRFLHFGRVAARADDVLNWLPARLTAASYAMLGHTAMALRCWRQQAPQWDSPNAGPVMAAGAGALQCQLGGAARYHGQLEARPTLGCGAAPTVADIGRALRLVRHTGLAWLTALCAIGGYRCLS